MSDLSDLAVRVARAEIERDEWKRKYDELSRASVAWHTQDKEKLLETLHIIGIPAKDLVDIYKIEAEWRTAGGRPEWLETYRELWELREASNAESRSE